MLPLLPCPCANLVSVLKSFFSITSFLKITNSALMEMRLNFPVGLEMRRPIIVGPSHQRQTGRGGLAPQGLNSLPPTPAPSARLQPPAPSPAPCSAYPRARPLTGSTLGEAISAGRNLHRSPRLCLAQPLPARGRLPPGPSPCPEGRQAQPLWRKEQVI